MHPCPPFVKKTLKMEPLDLSSKISRFSDYGRGPRSCVKTKDTVIEGSSMAGLGLGLRAGLGGNNGGQRHKQQCSSASFTFLQLQELQHQVLIYKFMEIGLPVPQHLLLPICKSLANSFSHLKGLGFVSSLENYCDYGKSMEAEPGRCRRTDGKKWRCSKHVVNPHQKYCERHMHRGGGGGAAGRRQQEQKLRSKLVLHEEASDDVPASTATTTSNK